MPIGRPAHIRVPGAHRSAPALMTGHPTFRTRLWRRSEALGLLGYSNYNEYLSSEHWQQTRQAFRESEHPQECICGETEALDLHHKTYERIGQELLTDLALLCRPCHEALHVLERRGVMGLDPAELSDEERAAVYAVEQAARREQAEADIREARRDTRPLPVRIAEVMEEAERAGVDTRNFHTMVNRRLDAIQRQINQRTGRA